jgi:hypothetical protein
MAITTFDPGFIASAKQYVAISKTGSRTTVAAGSTGLLDIAGAPGAGVLAGTSTTTGVVPTDATAGCPTINAFGGGATGYLAQIGYGSTVACRLRLFDLLWKGGAYAFNVNTSGNTPNSFSSRVPGGTDFTDTQLWLEQVTAGTGVQNVNVTYTNQAGTAGRSTGTVAAPAALILGRMFQLPLQSGDTGVQGVTGVVGSVASVGTFNILVVRPIWSGRVMIANHGDVHDLARTGMPIIYADSALFLMSVTDATSTGVIDVELVVANG